MRVCFTSVGCKLNQAELEHTARGFADAGHRITRDLASADLHIVNSCTVTHAAARDSRKVARRGRRANPTIRTVLTGCYVAGNEDEARQRTGADLIVPNDRKDSLLATVEAAFPDLAIRREDGADASALPYRQLEFGHARALVKIEDGCNMQCSFCIIPATRGTQRSRPPREILDEVDRLVASGFSEVVLTGVQISAYRHRGLGLYDLTEKILEKTRVRRLRLTSIAPWHFDERLLDLLQADRLCRHVHLSLQSGSNPTLALMKRPYTAGEFAELVARIRARVPGIAITTDVIAGFPGETDDEFEESIGFVRDTAFARVHVFPYSVRSGTRAAVLPGHLGAEVKRARVRRLIEVAQEAEREFVESQIGQTTEVLWEFREGQTWHGTSDNYVRVLTASSRALGREVTRSLLCRRTDNRAVAILSGAAENPHGRTVHAA